jgi:OPA family glycerol-3-phosphate transporter-like MFS transporter
VIKGKNEKQQIFLFISLCCLAYFTSYLTRTNYGAAIAEIIYSMGITKTQASMAVTGSFITYGAGQVLNGIIGDHIKPRTMIFSGLFIASACNILMSALSNVYIMTAVWCINGFAQSMMWPPLARIMAENLSPDNYKKACVAVSAAASIATIAIYMVVPLCIALSGWRTVFLISASCGFVVAVIWLLTIHRVIPTAASHEEKGIIKADSSPDTGNNSLFSYFGLVPIMVIIFLQGILRDGITTWMPSYINDTYGLGVSISILTTSVLPVFTIISLMAASYVHKLIKNEVKAAVYIWALGFICSFVLLFVYSSQAVLSVAMMTIITGCMHGVNLMFISILPARYISSGRVSSVTGILNAFTYTGSAVSAYGIAALTEHFGWKLTIIIWCLIALCGTIMNIYCAKKWKHA